MRMFLTCLAPLGLAVVGLTAVVAACSSADKRRGYATDTSDGGVEGGVEGGSVLIPPDADVSCQGLACKRENCEGGLTTTITGKVYDPAGANPLYNVLVYIPGGPNADAELPPIKDGVQCETCASIAIDPLVSALTNTKGEFELKDVPIDKDVPIVIQVGKWRRKLKFDVTKKCTANAVPNKSFRLPRNGSEGDMPQIAVTSGACDQLECLLRGIGIDDNEFVKGHDTSGHVHVFNGYGGTFVGAPQAGGTEGDEFGGELWNDVEKLKKYDVTMLSCECSERYENKGGPVGRAGARQSMWDYANLGGRIFATHYHNAWIKDSPQLDWQQTANWGWNPPCVFDTYKIDQSFPKGASFADWLVEVNASSTKGEIQLSGVSCALGSVNSPTQSWIKGGDKDVRYFTFNTPISEEPKNQCGRVVYADLHQIGDSEVEPFPDGCPGPGGLSASQRALEFMVFDLSGCVQADDTPPVAPR